MLFGLIIHTHRVDVVEMCSGGQKKRVVVELRIKQVVVGQQWWKWVVGTGGDENTSMCLSHCSFHMLFNCILQVLFIELILIWNGDMAGSVTVP